MFLSVVEAIDPRRTSCIYTKNDFQLFCALETRLPEIITRFGLCQYFLSTAIARVLLAAISLKETARYPLRLFEVSGSLGKAIRQVAIDSNLYKLSDRLLDHPMYQDKGNGLDECIYQNFERILHGGTANNPNPLLNIGLLSLRGRDFLKGYTSHIISKQGAKSVACRTFAHT